MKTTTVSGSKIRIFKGGEDHLSSYFINKNNNKPRVHYC